ADEEIAAEAPEARRSHRQPPRGVQLPALSDAREQAAGRVELVDEAEALARDLVLGIRVLLRIRHEDAAADILDAERGVPARQLRVDERARSGDEPEAPVEDVDAGVVEVVRVQAVARDREALVDRADARPVD